MNIIKSFNETLRYMDTVLDDKIDKKRVEHLSGYSYPMFSRLFSILTDITLSEYLRNRRLSEAAACLRESEEKVIDIAIRFGYESADSFGAAFKVFHQYTPSEVRAGKPFKVYSGLQLVMNMQGGRDMNITIQKKESFKVAGINKQDYEIGRASCRERV